MRARVGMQSARSPSGTAATSTRLMSACLMKSQRSSKLQKKLAWTASADDNAAAYERVAGSVREGTASASSPSGANTRSASDRYIWPYI